MDDCLSSMHMSLNLMDDIISWTFSKECFEHFKKQIETLSETISNPVNETIHENTEIVPMKTKKNKYITTTTMTAVFRVLLFIFSKAAVTLHIGVPF